MALISLQNIEISYGGPKLLNKASLQIENGERICLLGRNGEGKSTLLRLIAGEEQPDGGEIIFQAGAKIGYLQQKVPEGLPGTVYDLVKEGASRHDDEWERDQNTKKAIAKMGLDPDALFDSLSGGQKRRALLGKALVPEPDVLILDEPTNHLDIESIQWLENFLFRYQGTVLFVSHDRAFLRKLANRIVELDRGQMTSWTCGYDKFLERKQLLLETEEKQHALFDKKLAQEETWLRKGVKARRTRNEGRVRALAKMRNERGQRRTLKGPATILAQEAERSGTKVITAKNISYAWNTLPIITDFSTKIMRGDKIGIIGPNGCGKTTLIKLLLEQLKPQQGEIELGTKLEVAYFDQHRAILDEDKSVAQNISGDNDHVTFQGRQRHVLSYLEDFLFPPDRSRTAVRALSGGERNRLLLAKVFTNPCNVLVLDEPTNDLDMETLELLEDLLVEFGGTLLLVSHDRDFLNSVVTSTLVFEENGQIGEFVGGYDDWIEQRTIQQKAVAGTGGERNKKDRVAQKLSNKERCELRSLPRKIEALEIELEALHQRMNDPDFYKQPPGSIKTATDRAEAIPHELEECFERWEDLESRQGG
jgi:ATP-binding cassette subfamily F protein uup